MQVAPVRETGILTRMRLPDAAVFVALDQNPAMPFIDT
jgi:hypothetical protein